MKRVFGFIATKETTKRRPYAGCQDFLPLKNLPGHGSADRFAQVAKRVNFKA